MAKISLKNKKKLFLYFFLSFIFLQNNSAQNSLKTRLNIPFSFQNRNLQNPQIGGLDHPQFSAADLNNDKKLDLYIFDKAANKHITFIQENQTWQWQEGLTDYFPKLESWVFLLDYNQDGVIDIFTYSYDTPTTGIAVYKGCWKDDRLHFDRLLFSEYGFDQVVSPLNSFYDYLYVTKINIPAIGDVDGDGDVDILAYDVLGSSYLTYYQNQSVERGFGVDTLLFERMDDCWGGFYEDLNGNILMAETAGECASPMALSPDHSKVVHGSTSLNIVDYNGDGLADLLVSDALTSYISLLLNTGTTTTAHITQQRTDFPAYDLPIYIKYAPAVYVLDLDFDGNKDLLATPQLSISENVRVAHFYKNTAPNNADSMQFAFQTDRFLVDEMIDFGTGTHPAIADVNDDGLLDLVVGNYGYFVKGGDRDARLTLCLNVGTTNAPAFEVTDEDFLGFSGFEGAWSLTPTFGDLDADGDLDLLMGTSLGTLLYAENQANDGQAAMQFGAIERDWMAIHDINHPLGLATVPTLVDVDEDGDLDLLVGEASGNVNFFKNTGTANLPYFDPNLQAASNDSFWGGVDVRQFGYPKGYSAPHWVETADEAFLLVASRTIGVVRYTFEGENEPILVRDSLPFLSEKYGHNLHIAHADLDNDGQLDFVVGHERGGLSFFKSDWPVKGTMTNIEENSAGVILEEPVIYIQNNFFNIKFNTNNNESFILKIIDLQGNMVSSTRFFSHQNEQIDGRHLPKGLYIAAVESEGGSRIFSKKVSLY